MRYRTASPRTWLPRAPSSWRASPRTASPLAGLGIWVALAVVPIGALGWALTESGVDASVAVEMTNDAGARALFPTGPGLAPGASRAACLSVGATGAGPDDEVRFLVQDLTGTLAPQLQVDVYVGTGAGYADCSGFAGTRVYRGTLDGLAGLSDQGIASGWRPGSSSRRSFKVVVTLADAPAGAGGRAGATFVWRLEAGATATPTPTADPTGEPGGPGGPGGPGPDPTSGSTPSAAPTGSPAGGDTDPATVPGGTAAGGPRPAPGSSATGTPADPDPGPTGSGSPPGSGPGSGTGSGSGSGSGETDLDLTRTVPVQVGRTVIGVLAKPQFTLTPLLLVLLFMLVQHRIDARDPKLAEASRTRRDLTVAFPDGSAEVGPR